MLYVDPYGLFYPGPWVEPVVEGVETVSAAAATAVGAGIIALAFPTPTAGPNEDEPQPSSNVIPFPTKPSSTSTSNNCPTDNGCARDQMALLSHGLLLENLLRAGTVTVQDYVLKARAFNKAVATHNARCPGYPVRPFAIGPRGV